MSFSFVNLDDKALEELASALWEERKRRIIKRIGNYPKPSNTEGVEAIKLYWRQHHGMSLMEAKTIIDYYRDDKCSD